MRLVTPGERRSVQVSHGIDPGITAAVVRVLLSRSSVAPKTLGSPGPTRDELLIVVSAALAAPGQGGLRPYRFIAIEGEGRLRLAQAFLEVRKKASPRINPKELARTRCRTMRAPTLIGIVARFVPHHPRVPVHEQYISVGAAIQGILLACHALGYGAIVLSGRRPRAHLLHLLLGLAPAERLVGFISIGTPTKKINPKRRPSPDEFLQVWGRGENGESKVTTSNRQQAVRDALNVERLRRSW
jgi:nitroreductase